MKTLSPAVITLPWRQDAAEFYFSRLSHLPWAMLLHSGYADHPYSRFDIVVAEPICTLTTFGKETVVSESEKRTTTTDDPLQVLQQVLDRADIRPTHNEDLPFQGGALGLFGYDLGRRFESLPEIAEQDIVLPDMAVGIYDWALIVDHQRHTVSLLSHNDVNARRAWLESQQFSPQEDFTLTSDWQSNMTREQYGEKFRQVQEYLRTGVAAPKPSPEEVRAMMLRHARMQVEYKGDYTGIREMRKHISWYTAGMPHSARLRARINSVESLEELEEILTSGCC